MSPRLRALLPLVMLALWLVPSPSLAKGIADVDETEIETVGVEKLVLEGYEKRKWKRPLTSRLSFQRTLWTINSGPRPYDDRIGFSHQVRPPEESDAAYGQWPEVYVGMQPGRELIAAINEMIVGPPDPEVKRRKVQAEAAIENLREEVTRLRITINDTRDRIDEIKSHDFWWITQGLKVLGLESTIEDWEEEIDDLEDDWDAQEKKAAAADLKLRPYFASFGDELTLKVNRRGTKVKLRGRLLVQARHRTTGEIIEGFFKIDHKARIAP